MSSPTLSTQSSSSDSHPPLPYRDGEELNAYIEDLVAQMHSRLTQTGTSILSKMDEMGRQVDELERQVDAMVERANNSADKTPSSSPSSHKSSTSPPLPITPKSHRRNRSQPCEV